MPVHHATDAQTLNAIIQQVWKWGKSHFTWCMRNPQRSVGQNFNKNVKHQSVVIKIHADWHDNSRKLANFFEEIAGQRPQMAFVVAHVDKIPLEQITQCQGTWFHYWFSKWFLAVLLHFITVPTFRFDSELKYYFKSR